MKRKGDRVQYTFYIILHGYLQFNRVMTLLRSRHLPNRVSNYIRVARVVQQT